MKTHKDLRRVISMLLVCAMLLAAMPAVFAEGEGTTVYLKPNANWLQGGARFAAYYFGNGDGWVSMTDADGDGYYECVIPAGYPNVIFCRMNPATEDNNWNNKWNQTNDLTVPTDENNCYIVADGTWDNGGGIWTVKPAATDPKYYLAGDEALVGIEWDVDGREMISAGDGMFEVNFKFVPAGKYEVKVTDGTWHNSWGKKDSDENFVIELNAESHVTVTFDSNTKTVDYAPMVVIYTVAGNTGLTGADWNPAENPMNPGEEGMHTITFENVEPGSHAFKVTDGTWGYSWGKDGGNENYPVNVTQKSNVTITFNADTKEITVDLKEVPGESKPDESKPDESKPDESKPDESQPDESQPDESKPDESKPDESKPDESQPDESKPDESQPDESQPDESKPDESKPDESKPDESQPDESKPDESKPDESKPDESKPDESKPDESKPDNTVYHVAGTENMCGDDWNPAGNPMTKGENGLHTITFTEVPAGKVEFKITDGSWTNSWGNNGGNYRLDLDAKSNVTIIFDPVNKVATWKTEALEEAKPTEAPTYFTVAGNKALCGAEWDATQNPMTKGDNGLYTITFAGVPAGKHEFKVTVGSWNDSWGKDGGSNNEVLELTAKSDVTITFDAVSKKITVTTKALEQPAETTKPAETTAPDQTQPDEPSDPEAYDYTVAGTKKLCGAEWDPSKNPMVPGGDGKYSITFQAVPAGKHEFKVTDGTWNNSWGDNGNNYAFNLVAISNVTITFDPETKDIFIAVVEVEGVETPEYDVTIHFLPSEDWADTINGYVWDESGEMMGTWPGTAIAANSEHEGWYDLKITTVVSDGFQFIFNDGKNQTADLSTGALTGDLELWYVGQTRYTVAPEAWSGIPTFTYTIHFQNAEGWENVNAYAWLDGDKLLGDWPGVAVKENKGNPGWYDVVLTVPSNALQIIFSNGEGKQTADIAVEAPSEDRKVELWIQTEASYTEPENWVQVAPGNTVKLHFMQPYVSWGSNIKAWIWSGNGDVPGYEDYHIAWPGKSVEADPEHPGWYSLEITTELPSFSFIFNSNGYQTKDLSTGEILGDMELWVYGNEIYTSMPTTTPQTGDSTNVALYVCLLALSVLALGAVVGLKKRAAK